LLRKCNKLYSINQNEEFASGVYHAYCTFCIQIKVGWEKILKERYLKPLCSWVNCKAVAESEVRISVYQVYLTIQFLCVCNGNSICSLDLHPRAGLLWKTNLQEFRLFILSFLLVKLAICAYKLKKMKF